MEAKINKTLADLKAQKQTAMDNIQSDYYNIRTPLYMDNERFSWAVKTINNKFDQLESDLLEQYENSQKTT